MTNLKEYNGDLLEAKVDVIIHQCNVMSRGVSGLAASIFKKHPECNTYKDNPDPRHYMESKIFRVQGAPYKYVANLYGQIFPGRATHGWDSPQSRLDAFELGMEDVFYLVNEGQVESIGFPYLFGCGLAGGDWNKYYTIITKFANWKPEIEFHIIKKV